MTPLRVGVIAAFVAFSVVAIIMNTMMHGWLAWYRLAREGKHVQATITARRPEFHETCHFTYTVASRTYEGADQG